MTLPFLLRAALLGLLLACRVAAAGDEAPSPAADSGVRMSVVLFPSDPPGQRQRAPGGGRVLMPAAVYTPAQGANPYGPAVLLLDQGPGFHPLEPGQATRFAAERLARRGYTVMSLYSGIERGFSLTPFETFVWGVKAAIDYLEMAGHEDIVLGGQGYGAILAAHYLSTQADESADNGPERRVKAALLLNPLTELRHYPRADLAGPRYDQLLAQAQASMARGRGGYPSGNTMEPGHGPDAKADPWLLPGPYLMPAEGFLNWFGPPAAERNARALAQLPVPALVIAGDQDPSVSIPALRGLRTAASVDLQVRPGADAHFSGQQDAVTDAIDRWLSTHDLGPRPRVRLQVLQLATEGGRVLQGVLYTPEKDCRRGGQPALCAATDPKKPALMLLHGRTGDNLYASTHWMGWRLAQQGYAVFSPGLRISGTAGFESSSLAESVVDIGRWVDRAAALGFKRVVLGGHSNGGIWLSNYLSQTQDRRVVGTLYFAPTRDSPTHQRELVGDAAYARMVQDAEAAVARGDGWREPIGLLAASVFLDNNGPRSRAMHTERVKEFDRPGLAIVGDQDALMTPAFVEQFGRAYRGPLKLLRYEGGSHGLREHKDRLATDVAGWLQATFPSPPAPRP